jgi:hypothetical protein
MKKSAILFASLAWVGLAQAAVLSYSFSNPTAQAEISQTGALGLFDSRLGTLTSVSLTLSGAKFETYTLTNVSALAQTTNVSVVTDLLWSSSLTGLDAAVRAAPISLSAETGFTTYAAGASALISGSDNDTRTLTSALELAGLLDVFKSSGGGLFSLQCQSLSGVSIRGGGGNIAVSSADNRLGCGAQIDYTYTAATGGGSSTVPEPSAFVAALAGLGLLVRRVRRQSAA